MNLTRVGSALLCLLLGATTVAQKPPAVTDPRDSFRVRIEGLAFTEAAFSCRYGQKPRTTVDAEALIREYLKTRGLADEPRTRALVDALLDFQRYPTVAHLDLLEARHEATGLRTSVAEDIARCLLTHSPYPREPVDDLLQVMAAVRPAPVGLFWAAMSLSWRGETVRAIEYFQRALGADPRNSRTRLLYAMALLEEQRPADALAVLEPIPRSWAPEATAYWRAQALMALNRPRQARALLERLPRWVHTFETTPPGALDALTVSLPMMPGCAIATTYSLEGQQARAREMLVAIKNCPTELAAVELRSGHAFRAVEILEETDRLYRTYDLVEVSIEARARLGACEWARHDLGILKPGASATDVRRKVDAICPNAPTPATSPALKGRLMAPRLKPFAERPLSRINDIGRWKRQRTARVAVPYPALAPFNIYAISPAAKQMFAVSTSTAVDPGRNSTHGLWLHVSSDAGLHWEGPYYLGLSERFVYYVRLVAHQPSSGGRLPLEVQNLQPFPPASSPPRKSSELLEHYMLDIDLDALRRDSDGDGLTDLLEERLLLDPHARDTDGDGIADAQDVLPLEARDADVPPYVRQLWSALLPVLAGEQRLPPEQKTPRRPVAVEGPRLFAKERTVFIRSTSCPASHASPIRAICVTPEVHQLYVAKFGELWPMDLSRVVFDETREHAFVHYAFTYSGGTLRATKGDGVWLFQPISTWIE